MCMSNTILDVSVLVYTDFHLILVRVISFVVELTLFSLEALQVFVIWVRNASVHFDMQFRFALYIFYSLMLFICEKYRD